MQRKRQKEEWAEIARRGSAQHLLVIDSAAELYRQRLFGTAHGTRWNPTRYRQFDRARWFSREDWQTYQRLLQYGEEHRPRYLLRLADEYQRRITAHRAFGKKMVGKDFPNLTNNRLAKIFSAWYWHPMQFWCFAYDYIFINSFLPEVIMIEVQKRVPNLVEQNQILGVLCMADRASDQWQEKKALVTLAKHLRARRGRLRSVWTERSLTRHLKSYEHLGLYYFRGQPYTLEVIFRRLQEYLRLSNKDFTQLLLDLKDQASNARNTALLIRRLRFNEKTKARIRAIKRWATLSNYVDETYGFVVNALMPMWNELQKRLGVTWDELFSLRGQEIVHAINHGGITRQMKRVAEARFRNHAIILENGKVQVLHGKRLNAYHRREKKTGRVAFSAAELRGQSASPGKVKGRVRIVFTIHDLDRVERGDILVTDSTNPTFVPAMERAAAIVTDEGGLLSHAAIISRELNIPCVVGTKIGTKVLKDGDRVEVDADKGVVRRI